MSHYFSIPKMIRMTPNHLLKTFFEQMETPLISLDWTKCKQRDHKPIVLAMSWLSSEDQVRIETSLADIHELATAAGWNAIVEACALLGEKHFPHHNPSVCNYTRAMLTWLNHREVFEEAMRLRQVDQATYWRKRTDVPRINPRVTSESLREFGAAIANCLRQEEGRGKNCTVDYLRRRDNVDVFLAYPDDFPQAQLAHDPQGMLRAQRTRPTFEIVFAYHQEHGTLELNAQVSSKLKPQLENLFGQIILGEDLGPPSKRPFHLNHLKDRRFSLETDPQDGVTASITKLRLDSARWGKIGLEPHKTERDGDVYAMVDQCLNTQNIGWDEVNVGMASILFEFSVPRGKRSGSLEFHITYPNHCSIRRARPESLALVRKYLQRWRIARV